jgi:hypothetical protein
MPASTAIFQGLLEDCSYDAEPLVDDAGPPVGVGASTIRRTRELHRRDGGRGSDPSVQAHGEAQLGAGRRGRQSRWGSPPPSGVFRGIAIHDLQNSICAQVEAWS